MEWKIFYTYNNNLPDLNESLEIIGFFSNVGFYIECTLLTDHELIPAIVNCHLYDKNLYNTVYITETSP